VISGRLRNGYRGDVVISVRVGWLLAIAVTGVAGCGDTAFSIDVDASSPAIDTGTPHKPGVRPDPPPHDDVGADVSPPDAGVSPPDAGADVSPPVKVTGWECTVPYEIDSGTVGVEGYAVGCTCKASSTGTSAPGACTSAGWTCAKNVGATETSCGCFVGPDSAQHASAIGQPTEVCP
jgi:hypothetical protein